MKISRQTALFILAIIGGVLFQLHNPAANGQTVAGSTCSYGQLFYHSLNWRQSAFNASFPANAGISEDVNYDRGEAIEEYFQKDNVALTALDSLPPGMSMTSMNVGYPDGPIIQDGLTYKGEPLNQWIYENLGQSYPPLIRYVFTGNPTQQGTYSFRLQAVSPSCKEIENFTVNITAPAQPQAVYTPPPLPSAPTSTNGVINFVKTIFYNDPAPNASQNLGDVIVWGKKGNKFAIAGEYGGNIANLPLNSSAMYGGGGLWTLNEDGSDVQDHELRDAGYLGDTTPHHGIRNPGGVLHYDWSSTAGFLADNGPSGGAMPWGMTPGQIAANLKTAKNAYRSVYYQESGSGAAVKSVSPIADWNLGESQFPNTTILMLNKKAIFGGELFSLPKWKDLGAVDSAIAGSAATIGNNVLLGTFNAAANSVELRFYTIGDDGNTDPITGNILDSGYKEVGTALDQSAYPPKLAVAETKSSYDYSTGNTIASDTKIKVYKLTSSGGVLLDKTLSAPAGYPFGIWGDYVVLQNRSAQEAVPGNLGYTGAAQYYRSALEVWKNGAKIDSVKLPAGFILNGNGLAISRKGYIAMVVGGTPREATAYLYKLNPSAQKNVSSNPGTTPVTPPAGNPAAATTTSDCVNKYGSSCDQIQALIRQICALAPSSPVCSPSRAP